MDCQTAQEQILESLAETRPGAAAPELETHLADCTVCRSFLETQIALDLQLTAAISASPLSPAFRQTLLKKVHPEPLTAWPDFLPDVAHLTGCICAIAVSLSVLPYSAGSVISAGLVFTLATYFVQTVLRGSLEAWED